MGKADTDLNQALLTSSDSGRATRVTVVAPSDLDENFTFEAVHLGTTFTVTVPPGG
eukprot:CAMPEP_0172494764 /NCGR_PEP_ID=MMETSP1066-20121228/56070_1 /TAXON_ID=671091 /ORGANISM="Coscinodiscus wailesii, Strain CCMP2513" /LENGTH=55 /DNA_ID=CAMNT_0013266001 /DNA_START=23 /DNA_END=186 /DNA_ORIENTATION=+